MFFCSVSHEPGWFFPLLLALLWVITFSLQLPPHSTCMSSSGVMPSLSHHLPCLGVCSEKLFLLWALWTDGPLCSLPALPLGALEKWINECGQQHFERCQAVYIRWKNTLYSIKASAGVKTPLGLKTEPFYKSFLRVLNLLYCSVL